MTKRPTAGQSFFEFAEFLRNFIGKEGVANKTPGSMKG
jgi:hypothetical protein